MTSDDDHSAVTYEEDVCIIIDNGSGSIKAGMSCNEKPTAVFPSTIGIPRKKFAGSMQEFYCGDLISDKRNKLTTHQPLENGIVQNFEHMEMLWEYTIDEVLQVDPMKHPILLTEPPYNPKNTRERIVEIMFETFAVPQMNLSIQGVLALLGQGRTTGLVLDSGDGVSHTIPVFDGFGLPSCIQRLDLGGRDLNILLAKMIAQNGTSLTTSSERDYVRMMKEELCYVSKDPATEQAEHRDFTLPDGRIITLGDERWRIPEALFQPQMVGLETGSGLGGLVWETVQKCEIDVRPAMLSNIVLSGGSTLYPNFPERLNKELSQFAPVAMASRIKVLAMPDRKFAVYTGAQVYANLKLMQPENWMTAAEYEEYGPKHIHDKVLLKYS
eukprot:GEMP01032446.1.p1 GENE.GEMP01032446.1~~GEMP01032446.1.p1  ORF type:complete len:384 (+),score=55.69 GEMP01032446.1:3-1154(+)